MQMANVSASFKQGITMESFGTVRADKNFGSIEGAEACTKHNEAEHVPASASKYLPAWREIV
jgi:hypothetical protein